MSKSHSILLFMIISLFGMVIVPGAVAAAGNGSVYVSTNGNDSWDGLSDTFNGSSGPKATIKNATSISATNDTIYVASGTYRENQINITNSMRIIGENRANTIINGTNSGFIFNIPSGVYVALANLTLTQGQNEKGGAIVNNGTLTIVDSQFTSNNVTKSGGAIYNIGTLTIHNSSFTNNHATGRGNAGAIHNSGSLNVNNTVFKDNTAGVYGGAIINEGTAIIKGSTFIGNSLVVDGNVSHQGGAIHNYGVLIIDGTTFTNNAATGNAGSGGAIFNTGGSLTVNNSTFTNNTAGNVGGIYSSLGATITNSTFIGNTGAIKGGNLKIDNCKFIENSWTIVHNGLNKVYGDFEPSTISNSVFINNGGVISNTYGGKLKLINSIITGNTGGTLGIISNGMKTGSNDPIGEIDIINSVITGNTGSSRLIYNGDGRITVISSVISNNTLTSDSSTASTIYNFRGDLNLYFNQITNNGGFYDVYSPVSSVYADNNWWGSNNGTNRVYINRKGVSSWLVLTAYLDESVVNLGDSVNAVVNMWYNNWGEYLDPTNGYVLDGIEVDLTSLLGKFLDSTVTLFNGMAQTVFTPDILDSGTVSVKVNGQTIVELVIHVLDGFNLNRLTSKERQDLRDAFNVSRETGLQWIEDYLTNKNNTDTQDNNTNNTTTNSTRTNSSSSSDGSPGGFSSGTSDGSPTGSNPQEIGDGQTPAANDGSSMGSNPLESGDRSSPGDTALSVAGESVGDAGQSHKSYEITTNTSRSGGSPQSDTTLIAMMGVVLLLILLGVGFYFKK